MEMNNEISPPKYCVKCGKQNDAVNDFCASCGNPFNAPVAVTPATPAVAPVPVDPRYDFIRNNAATYVYKFNKMASKKKIASWNWPAFFFSGYWFLYRKMYGIGFAILGLGILARIVLSTAYDFFWGLIAAYSVNLAFNIVIGIFANAIYMKYVGKQLDLAMNTDQVQKRMIFYKKGGINATAVIFAVLGIVVLSSILSYVSGYFFKP